MKFLLQFNTRLSKPVFLLDWRCLRNSPRTGLEHCCEYRAPREDRSSNWCMIERPCKHYTIPAYPLVFPVHPPDPPTHTPSVRTFERLPLRARARCMSPNTTQYRAEKVQEGGKAVISHPLGRDFVSRLKAVDGTVVPHDLPERDELERLVQVGGRICLSVCRLSSVVCLSVFYLM